MSDEELVAVLADAGGGPLGDEPAVAAALAALLAQGRASWPTLRRDDVAFVRRIARHLPCVAPADALRRLHGGDLFLAWACERGDRAAIAIFEEEFLSSVPRSIARIERAPARIDEILQSIRVMVLTGDPPRISQYSGRGSLRGWLRAVAVNAALMARRPAQEAPHDSRDLSDRALAGGLDPEIQLLRERYHLPFQAALNEALKSLTARQRNLLRACFVEGLSIDEVGARFRVHRATAARWLQAARARLLEETRRRVMERVAVTASEFESLAQLLESQLSISLGGSSPSQGDVSA